MKTVSTKVDESVYQKLAESCSIPGNCISERIRNLIEASLDNKEGKKTKKIPVIHLYWKDNNLVQGETTWREERQIT